VGTLASARAEGVSIRTLAAAAGMSPSRVHQLIADADLEALDAALGELRAAGWPAPEDPDRGEDTDLDGRDHVADRLSDEVEWLRRCGDWLRQLDRGGYGPAVNLRPSADWPPWSRAERLHTPLVGGLIPSSPVCLGAGGAAVPGAVPGAVVDGPALAAVVADAAGVSPGPAWAQPHAGQASVPRALAHASASSRRPCSQRSCGCGRTRSLAAPRWAMPRARW
jgi:hypothetical protein